MVNSTERSDILVFNCYLCHVRFLLTCYVCSTKIGEISDISKCFENFVSQALGVLTRIYAAELRYNLWQKKSYPNRLRIILAEKNVTNHWLATEMGVTDMTVSRWCTNRIQPSISQLVQMSKLLDTEMEKFIDTSVDPG